MCRLERYDGAFSTLNGVLREREAVDPKPYTLNIHSVDYNDFGNLDFGG